MQGTASHRVHPAPTSWMFYELVFYCVAKHPKAGGLKQQSFIMIQGSRGCLGGGWTRGSLGSTSALRASHSPQGPVRRPRHVLTVMERSVDENKWFLEVWGLNGICRLDPESREEINISLL